MVFTGTQSTGFDLWNLTKGNALNQAGTYGANLAVIGVIDPAKLHRIRNILGWNIQNSPGSSSLIKDQSSGTYHYDDTANTQYYVNATIGGMDSSATLFSNSIGTWKIWRR